jgi:rhamnosyl/mannosyltransferase
LRILHLGKFDAFGGIERHVQGLLRGLAVQNDVEVVNLVANDRASTDEHRRYGYLTVRAAAYGVVASVALSPALMSLTPALHRRHRFDIVHLHFPDPLGQLAASLLPREVARVVSWHSDIIRQRTALAAYQPLMTAFLRRTDAIIGATPLHFSGSKQIPVDIGADRRFVVPYGFELERWSALQPPSHRVKVLAEQKRGRFAVFALGRHVYYKGFDVLIEAMREVDGLLWLGGNGPLTGRLAAQIQSLGLGDKIHLVGAIPEAEIGAYYQACDVFCLPSTEQSEQFGLVQLEAMYFQRPVVSTRLGTGVEWVNQDGVTGLLVVPGAAKALTAALNQLKADPALRFRMGAAGREHVIGRFSSATMVAQTMEVYRQVLDRRRA